LLSIYIYIIGHPIDYMAQKKEGTFSILGIAGSLRRESFNRALLRAASEVVPRGVTLDVFSLKGIPLFNQDLEELRMPVRVKDFKDKIEGADAVLIATPEYTSSFPGVLKNALDWASRPHGHNSFEGKTVAVVSASTGALGGSRAQYHLRQVLLDLDARLVTRPGVFLSYAHRKFNANGELTDDIARSLLKELLHNVIATAISSRGGRQEIAPGETASAMMTS
jgi:chromate reductase